MGQDVKASSLLLSYGPLLLIAAATGILYWTRPLVTSRPPEYSAPQQSLTGQVPARLWQDPLQAVREAKEPTGAAAEPRKPVTSGDRVLPVMIHGGYSAEDHEKRLRTRYAVLAALDEAGYIPVSTESLKFVALPAGFCVPCDRTQSRAGCETADFRVPYERLVRREGSGAGIVVLWLDATAFASQPFRCLCRLVQNAALRPEERNVPILGPPTSDGLKAMLTEDAGELSCDPFLLKVYSPRATADFSPDTCPKCDLKRLSTVRERQPGKLIVRTIASDNALLDKLLCELKARRVDRDADVAIISEWDTVYGRTMQQNLEDAGRYRLARVTYLRGLDGIALSAQEPDLKPGGKGSPTPQNGGRNDRQALLERPEGPSQLDYLRRLANVMAGSGRQFRAIGVLGSDVYDKLLVLQALRPRFPSAVFFTTDLDARILHPQEERWTRNLIVASSFGIDIQPMRDERTSPRAFRDSYQTATYWATRLAVSNAEERMRDQIAEASKPKLYEVGRTASYRLPEEGFQWRSDRLWAAVTGLAVLLTGAVVGFAASRWRAARKPTRWPFGRIALYGSFLLAVQAALGLTIFSTEGEVEPFAWFEGISIWPTELIRLAVGFLAFHFLTVSHCRLERNFGELGKLFPSGTESFAARGWVGTFTMHQSISPDAQWREYQRCSMLRYRVPRVALAALIYILLTGALFNGSSTVVPARGESGFLVDRTVLAISAGLLMILMFYVVDVTLFCECMIRRLLFHLRRRPEGFWEAKAEAGSEAGAGARSAVRLTAEHTAVVSGLICYPFFLLTILILSRLSYFDRWDWPVSLIVILGLNAFLVFACAVSLGRTAERLRRTVLAGLEDERMAAVQAAEDQQLKKIEFEMNDIRQEQRGAFAPVAQHPIVKALLLPSTGAGLTVLMEMLAGR